MTGAGCGAPSLQVCRHPRDPCPAEQGGRRPRRKREAVQQVHDTAATLDGAAPRPLVLERYRPVRRLGAGGFGVVWLAHDEHLDRAVAVKRIPVDDPAVARRAQREARAAARLSHPGIVALYEAGRDDDAVYLVSELVLGRTLAELIADGELSDRDVLAIGVVLCDALSHAHARGVVHRDVKPSNVLVPGDAPPGSKGAKLTDFGIALILDPATPDALTRTGDVVGTLAYMAPEQAEGRECTVTTDLYALGLVLYEALAGVNPIRAAGAAATARRVGSRLPPLGRLRRDLPLELCAALDRAVRPDPVDRGSVRALRTALSAARPEAGEEQGTIAGPALALPLTRRPARPAGAVVMEGQRRGGSPGPWQRLVAAAGIAALTAAALTWLGTSDPPVAPGAGALGAAAAVALLPRLGWLLVATAVCAWAADAAPAAAVVAALAALPVAPLLRRAAPGWWSAPALAPLLGVAALGAAWPALAGQAQRPWHRACLGALGLWWLALAELLTGNRLLLGPPQGAATGQAAGAAHTLDAAGSLVGSAVPAIALLWAAMAALLPVVVRGRRAPVDLLAATAWAAGLATGTQALAAALTPGGDATQPRGLVVAALAAVVLAVGARASRAAA
jgi:hypothetical protein